MYYYLWSLFFSNTFSTKKNRWTLCSAKMLQQLGIFLTLPAKICSLSSVSDIISQVNTWISTRHSPKVNSANTIAVSFSSSSNLGYFFFSHSIFTCRKRSPGWNVQSLYHMCMSSKGESNVHSFCFVTDYSLQVQIACYRKSTFWHNGIGRHSKSDCCLVVSINMTLAITFL